MIKNRIFIVALVSLVSTFAAAGAGQTDVETVQLRCESRKNLLGIDAAKPTLSLKMEERDLRQVVCQAASGTPSDGETSDICVIPKPVMAQRTDGVFLLIAGTPIYVQSSSAEMKQIGHYLAELIAPATGWKLAVQVPWFTKTRGIILKLDASLKHLGEEGYRLTCTPQCVMIVAAKPAGVFYGVQTLRQLLPAPIESRQKVNNVAWTVPCVVVEDKPRFQWRGYLIDPARHFRTKEELKRYIDLLAFQKMNVFHLHLTDDQGWRVEIKKYPKLIEIGSRLPDYGGQRGDGWFYSQADLKELVAYAAERYVTIVPEIEMPGHSGAALSSYPALACGGKRPGGWSAPLCVSQEATFEFATNVLNEVLSLFPSPYIHVGADEVPADSWRHCQKCKPLMDKLAQISLPADVKSMRVKVTSGQGVPFHEDIARLQGEFIRKIDQYLAAHGRKMVGWDEILEGGLKADSPAVIMAWRGPTAVEGAGQQKHATIVSLHPDYYLDNDTSLQRTYEYEPVPETIPPELEKYVIGVQGNMWGEQTQTMQRIDQRSFPRLTAIAETAWTGRERKNFKDFLQRWKVVRQRLEMMGVTCRNP